MRKSGPAYTPARKKLESLVDPLQGIIGIKLTHLLAGVAGGIVRALLAGGSWLAAISSVVVGSLTAGYLTAPIYAGAKTWLPVIGHDVSSEHAISFLVGLTAMLICEGVLRAAHGWSKNPKMPNSGKP